MYHIFAKQPILRQMFAEGGMFGAAKKVSKSTSKKTADKPEVVVAGISDKLEDFNNLKDEIAEREAKLKMIDGEIRELAREKFIELLKAGDLKGDKLGYYLRGDKGGCLMVLPTDRYLMIKTEEDADRLKEKFGEDIVETETRFYFNNEVLDRNRDAIEAAVKESKDISDADKKNLLIREDKSAIRKGTVHNLSKYGAKMIEAFQSIGVVFQLKNCGSKAADGMDVSSATTMTGIYAILSVHEIEKLREIIDGNSTFFDNSYNEGIYDKLFDYYSSIPESDGGMPYGTVKARTGDPQQWIADKAQKDLSA